MNSLTQNSDSVIRGRKGSIERRVVSIAAPSLQLFNKIKADSSIRIFQNTLRNFNSSRA